MQLARYIKPHFIRPISKEIKPPIKSEPKITIPDIVKGVTLGYRGNTVPKSFELFNKAENLFNQGHTSDALRYAKEAHQAFQIDYKNNIAISKHTGDIIRHLVEVAENKLKNRG